MGAQTSNIEKPQKEIEIEIDVDKVDANVDVNVDVDEIEIKDKVENIVIKGEAGEEYVVNFSCPKDVKEMFSQDVFGVAVRLITMITLMTLIFYGILIKQNQIKSFVKKFFKF